MSTEDTNVTRRRMFAAGGLGALAIAGFAQGAQGAEHTATATEKANVKVVETLCNAFNEPEKMAATLGDGAAVRMVEDKPAVIGPKMFLEEVKKIADPKVKYGVQIHETFARGPLVANVRTDTAVTQGKPDQAFKVVGVFIVKNGKIVEWTDYIVT
jgi:limonene-1,2-epoxide hydrolase